MTALQITTRTQGLHTIVALAGTLNLATGPSLASRLGELLRSGRHHLIVDGTDLHDCDVAGAQMLGCALARVQSVGGTLVVVCPADEVAGVLGSQATGLVVHPSLAQALGAATPTVG